SLARAACMVLKNSVFLPLPSGREVALTTGGLASPIGVSSDGRVSSGIAVPHEPQNLNDGFTEAPQVGQVRGETGPGIVLIPGCMYGVGPPNGSAVCAAAASAPAPSPSPLLLLRARPAAPAAEAGRASSDRASPQRLQARDPIGLKVRHPSQTSPTSIRPAVYPSAKWPSNCRKTYFFPGWRARDAACRTASLGSRSAIS